MHRRLALLVLVLGLIAAACGGTVSESTTTPTSGTSSTDAPAGTSDDTTSSTDGGSDDGSSTSVTVRPGGSIEGPTAPDFTIALGEQQSDSFTLSQGATPVYMVFWAEW